MNKPPCQSCGSVCYPDVRRRCAYCKHYVCDACQNYCENCEKIFCLGCMCDPNADNCTAPIGAPCEWCDDNKRTELVCVCCGDPTCADCGRQGQHGFSCTHCIQGEHADGCEFADHSEIISLVDKIAE